MFCVIEGVDGSGKSHLANELAEEINRQVRSPFAVVLKSNAMTAPSPKTVHRLQALHRLAWSYDPAEPVWEYSRLYWLYTLASWFTLFYQQCVEPLLIDDMIVITDGWFFKHQARFRLSGDEDFLDTANSVVQTLPQPDLVLFLDVSMDVIADRTGHPKPTEQGAFESNSLRDMDKMEQFVTYQKQTRDALVTLLNEHPTPVVSLHTRPGASEILALLRQRQGR